MSDDPLNDYLKRIAEASLLSSNEEISLVRKIELARKRLFHSVLSCDFAIRSIIEKLTLVGQGKLHAHRYFKTPQQSTGIAAEQHVRRLTGQLPALKDILQENIKDFEGTDRLGRKRLMQRRRTYAPIVEALGLRTRFVHTLIRQLQMKSARIDGIQARLTELEQHQGAGDQRRELERDFAKLKRDTLEDPAGLAGRTRVIGQRQRHYESCKRELLTRNLRLVVSIAGKYPCPGMDLLDLIQEGNLGLMQAVDEYEDQGYKFSTYATVWIRRAVVQAIRGQARTVRIPAPIASLRSRIRSSQHDLQAELGRIPSSEEIARRAEIPETEVNRLLGESWQTVSLDQPSGQADDRRLIDSIEDRKTKSPLESTTEELLRDRIKSFLESLNTRERKIISHRYGLAGQPCRTLEELSRDFNTSRQRILQIESRTIRKLKAIAQTWLDEKPHPLLHSRLEEQVSGSALQASCFAS